MKKQNTFGRTEPTMIVIIVVVRFAVCACVYGEEIVGSMPLYALSTMCV